jgi:DNA-directed RNA polymerase specialized sigma24 family protein
MAMTRSVDSVTEWIVSLKAGDAAAVDRILARYFESLVELAGARLRGMPRALADEEDAALSALDSFCRGAARGRFPKLDDRRDLWRLLVVITERKAIDQTVTERRQKRGGGRLRGTLGAVAADDSHGISARAVDPGPTPEFAAQMVDECQRLMDELRDDSLRRVALLRMEGYTNEEIARELRCSRRTVARKVELIRRTWLGEGERSDERAADRPK